jgi:hypothetical protein
LLGGVLVGRTRLPSRRQAHLVTIDIGLGTVKAVFDFLERLDSVGTLQMMLPFAGLLKKLMPCCASCQGLKPTPEAGFSPL